MALIPIPDDWDGVSWCCQVVEWPASVQWQAIFNGQITAPLRGRFWDGRTGTIVDAQAVGEEIFLKNLGGEMTCFEDLSASIEYLADRLYNKPCCPPSSGTVAVSGSGSAGAPSSDVVETTVTDDGETVPDGWAGTYEEYQAYKCNVATWILSQWEQDLSNTKLINWIAGLTLPEVVALLVATLISPIPGDEVVVMAGAFFYLITQGIVEPVLEMIGDELVANESDLICALYEAADVSEARDDVRAILEGAFSAGYSAIYAYGGNILIGAWMRNANLNKLFVEDTSMTFPDGVCPGCGASTVQLIFADPLYPGTVISGNLRAEPGPPQEIVIEGVVETYPEGNIAFLIEPAQAGRCFYFRLVEIISGPGTTNLNDGRLCGGAYQSGISVGQVWDLERYGQRSLATGTVRVRVEVSTDIFT